LADESSGIIAIPVVWIGSDDHPILLANQFVVQYQEDDEFFITIGQLQPPMILGDTPADRLDQAKKMSFVPVQVIARLSMTKARTLELIEVLQTNVRNYDNRKQG
jgi:hypothetical protein